MGLTESGPIFESVCFVNPPNFECNTHQCERERNLGTRRVTQRQTETQKSRDCLHTNATTNVTCEAPKLARQKCNGFENHSVAYRTSFNMSSRWYVLTT